jgi:hypothetical protein
MTTLTKRRATQTTRIHSPYSFKDSLKNPWLKRVYLFHDIGLDRLVNTYRDPVIVTRAVTFTSCRGSHHVSWGAPSRLGRERSVWACMRLV